MRTFRYVGILSTQLWGNGALYSPVLKSLFSLSDAVAMSNEEIGHGLVVLPTSPSSLTLVRRAILFSHTAQTLNKRHACIRERKSVLKLAQSNQPHV